MSKNFSSRRSFLDLLGRRALCRLSGLLVLCWFMVAAQALYAQNPVISLTLKNVTVHEVIEAVKKESGYSFWYRESEIDLSRRVSVEAQSQNVLKLLDGVLAEQGIRAKLEGRHIVLYKPAPADPNKEYQLTGRVETESGAPIVGASVIVEGTSNGMVTNSKGEFALNVTGGGGAQRVVHRLRRAAGVGRQSYAPDRSTERECADVGRCGGDRLRRSEEGQPDRFGRRAPDVGNREPAVDARLAGVVFDARRLYQSGFGETRQRRRDNPYSRCRYDEQFQPHGVGRRHGVLA